MSIPVLRVFDNTGKNIEIPAIKGEPGDLTSNILLSAGSDSGDYTLRYSDGIQISYGSFGAQVQSAESLAELNDTKIFCTLSLILPISMQNRIFSADFLFEPTLFLQYTDTDGEDVCLSLDGSATITSIENIKGLFLRSAVSTALTGRIRYCAMGRWK